MKRWFSFFTQNKVDQDILRQYIQGGLSAERRREILALIQQSAEWNREYLRLKQTIDALQSLPVFAPSDRVWQNIARQIKTEQPKPRWLARLDFDSPWLSPARLAPALATMLVVCWALYSADTLTDPSYRLVAMDESLIAAEADAYVAHHSLVGEPSVTQESLVAIYTYGWTE